MVNTKTGKVFFNKLTYIYLEMPKFEKTEEELETHFEKWLYILKNLDKLTSRPEKLQEKIFSQLFEQAEIAHFDRKEYQQYEESLKQYRDLKNVIDTAKEEGREEAREEGRVEEKQQMVINMHQADADADVNFIRQVTGLSIDKINEILDNE